MVIVVMDIYLQIVHHNSVTRMMDNSFEKVLLSETESDLETLSGLKIQFRTLVFKHFSGIFSRKSDSRDSVVILFIRPFVTLF